VHPERLFASSRSRILTTCSSALVNADISQPKRRDDGVIDRCKQVGWVAPITPDTRIPREHTFRQKSLTISLVTTSVGGRHVTKRLSHSSRKDDGVVFAGLVPESRTRLPAAYEMIAEVLEE